MRKTEIVRFVVLNLPIIRYELPIKTQLRFTYDVSLELYENRQVTIENFEAGGILLGSVYGSIIRIEAISTPGGGDIRGPTFFQRARERAQRLINQAYEYSYGTTTYLGEWHTHYQEGPQPSPLDISEIQQTFQQSKLPLKFIVSIIVGNGDFIGDFWVGFQDKNGLQSCSRLAE